MNKPFHYREHGVRSTKFCVLGVLGPDFSCIINIHHWDDRGAAASVVLIAIVSGARSKIWEYCDRTYRMVTYSSLLLGERALKWLQTRHTGSNVAA